MTSLHSALTAEQQLKQRMHEEQQQRMHEGQQRLLRQQRILMRTHAARAPPATTLRSATDAAPAEGGVSTKAPYANATSASDAAAATMTCSACVRVFVCVSGPRAATHVRARLCAWTRWECGVYKTNCLVLNFFLCLIIFWLARSCRV